PRAPRAQPDCPHLRASCPVTPEPNDKFYAVPAHEASVEVLKDPEVFSSAISVGGPFPPLPFEVRGEDITELIAAHREKLPMFEHMVTMDPPQHTYARSLLNRLLTPARLKENEDFMWRLADRQLDEFLANGRCEFLTEYAK